MLAKQIKVGGVYLAKISGKVVPCRVEVIRERTDHGKTVTVYDVRNTVTGRTTTFRSAQKFRSEVKPKEHVPADPTPARGVETTTIVAGAPKLSTLDRVRAACRNANGTSTPMYGTPTMDGGFIDDAGFRHEPGTWFASRPAQGEELAHTTD